VKYPTFTYEGCEVTIETEQRDDSKWRGRASIVDKRTGFVLDLFPAVGFEAEDDAFHTTLNRAEQEIVLIRDPSAIDHV
jgi:hypothetical protein